MYGWDPTGKKWVPLKVDADGSISIVETVAHLNDIGDVNVPTPGDQYFLYWDATASKWQCRLLLEADIPAIDHGSLGGLADDDHAQYPLLVGRAGGQTLKGGNAANEDLTLESTAHATKGHIIIPGLNKLAVGEVYDQAATHKCFEVNPLGKLLVWNELNMESYPIVSLADPVAAQDADTKAARDAAIATHTAIKSAHQSNVLSLTFIIDGGGSAIATGQKGHLEIPFACTITRVTALADQTGSIVVDIWKDSYANFPPTNADSITSATPPTISAAQKSQDSTLTGWTTAIAAGDILAFNVDSCTTITRVTISLRVEKS
ncbi:hypothetical protein ES708_08758 [subsurface metagenome]